MKVYTSAYSSIELEDESLLNVTWFKECKELGEEEVKKEISKVLAAVRKFEVKKVIVDARNYPFRTNDNIQRWINNEYIPKISDTTVQKYAIIVEEMITSTLDGLEDFYKDEIMEVKYFTNPEAARQWL